MRNRKIVTRVTFGAAVVLAIGAPAFAIEGGASFYLLGGKLPLSGVVPGPGMYFQNDVYINSAEAGGNIQLPIGGQIIANVEATIVFEAPTALYVTPLEILGGRLGFGATLPLGYADIEAQIGPLGTEDDVFTIGDPVAAAVLGWSVGNFHWSLGTTVNVPVGDYQEGEIANVALHRWAADVTGAITWLDPTIGLDLSAAMGVTFNGENEATDYDSGNELHFEAAATQHFSRSFYAGLAGYYNHQISPDSGDGATLGDFEGRVAALGGIAGYSFELGQLPVTTQLKYFHEFDVENRLQGDVAYVTFSMPLWVPAQAQAASLK